MPFPIDATSKHMVRARPADWIALSGLPPGTSLEVVDTDLSTVSRAADKLIRVLGPQPYVAHVEFQSGYDPRLDRRVLVYNVLAEDRLDMNVFSVVFLLRPETLGTGVTGRVRREWTKDHRLEFAYKLVKAWEIPVESLLTGGLGTLPLSPISQVHEAELTGVIERMKERFDREVGAEEAKELWTATRILMGLRWPPKLVGQLLRGVYGMKESATYQEIVQEGIQQGIEKGRAAEARRYLLHRGSKVIGAPDSSILVALEAINDPARLEELTDRVIDGRVGSWAELIGPIG
jgi:predicted transposase YdaD